MLMCNLLIIYAHIHILIHNRNKEIKNLKTKQILKLHTIKKINIFWFFTETVALAGLMDEYGAV